MIIENIALLDTVALLIDLPNEGLVRGHVGTAIEVLDSAHVLVEFADPRGIAYATVPLSMGKLLKLRHAPE